MPTLVKCLEIVEDEWSLIESIDSPEATPVSTRMILPFDYWLEHRDRWDSSFELGVWVDGDAEAEELAQHLDDVKLVAIRFAAFVDGRGLSLATLLRSRYGYEGELRAFGDIIVDLAQYLHRSGFDSFVVRDARDADLAVASIGSITDHYQASVRQPVPAFRRIAL